MSLRPSCFVFGRFVFLVLLLTFDVAAFASRVAIGHGHGGIAQESDVQSSASISEIWSGKFHSDEAKGLKFALVASVIGGAAYPVKKIGLDRAKDKGSSVSSGGLGLLREPVWWLGLAFVGLGEIFNSVAYAYSPAVFVAPLSALTVIFAAFFARALLGEAITAGVWQGGFLCTIGCIVVMTTAPARPMMTSSLEVMATLEQPVFAVYAVFIVVLAFACAMASKWRRDRGEKHSLILLIAVCSLVGSLLVMMIKSLSLCLRFSYEGRELLQLHLGFKIILVTLLIVLLIVQIAFLNCALDAFDTVLVTPVYYVLYTSLVLASNFVCMREWTQFHLRQGLLMCAGLSIIAVGVRMVHGSDVGKQQLGAAIQYRTFEK